VTGLLKRWWAQSDHYDWLSGYLRAREMSTPARVMMAFITASMALSLVALLTSVDGPHGPVPVAMTWTAFAGGVAGAALWIWRWPNRVQSVVFALATNTSIALACLAFPEPLPALTGCIAFATSGAYIAFFHASGFVLYNFAVAAAVGTIEAVRLASAGHPAVALVDLWLVLQVNIAMPLAIQRLVRNLGVDLLHADRDPLTGLLNRRAFQHKLLGVLLARRTADNHLVVALIDLDDFKSINDERGHTAGDQALVHAAHVFLANAGDDAVVARIGGEEFLVAQMSASADAEPLARRLCDAVSVLPIKVTASIGTASAALTGVDENDLQALVDRLVTCADTAMYHAKREGGNRFHHHGPRTPPNGWASSDG
jgi:diguanylate cyclase (GGDEF)-like protein